MTRKHSDEAVRGCFLFLIFPPLGLLYFLIKILEKERELSLIHI